MVRRLVAAGCYEKMMTDRLMGVLQPSDIFVDVGAQYGYYTLLAASVARKVIAFEPYGKKREILLGNVKRNELQNVEVRKEALFSKNEQAWLGRRSSRVQFKAAEGMKITLARFDDLEIGRVDAVKIDVEGAEADVLQGMRGTLGIWKPLVLVEVHKRMCDRFGHSPGHVEAFLSELGFTVTRLVTMGDRYHVMGR